MAKPYDSNLKTLVRADPLAFIRLLFPNAQLIREMPEELKEWKLDVDALFEVLVENGQQMLVHIEFQTYNDAEMDERLLRYNVLARCEYKLPVYSCVFHLLNDGKIPTSPLRWTVPTGQQTVQFDFQVIELGALTPEDILQTGQSGLFALLPFTKGGTKREVIETMFGELIEQEKINLLSVAQTLASLVMARENSPDQEWLIRRYRQMRDLIKDTPVYQEMVRDAREEGLEEGLEKGREEGLKEGLEIARQEKLEALHQMLLTVVHVRFPKLEKLAKRLTAGIEDQNELNDLVVKMSIARDAKEAKRYLLDEDEEDEG